MVRHDTLVQGASSCQSYIMMDKRHGQSGDEATVCKVLVLAIEVQICTAGGFRFCGVHPGEPGYCTPSIGLHLKITEAQDELDQISRVI